MRRQIVNFEGRQISLHQDAYTTEINNLHDGLNGETVFEASGHDLKSNEVVMVTWEINHPDFDSLDDLSDACDWGSPIRATVIDDECEDAHKCYLCGEYELFEHGVEVDPDGVSEFICCGCIEAEAPSPTEETKLAYEIYCGNEEMTEESRRVLTEAVNASRN